MHLVIPFAAPLSEGGRQAAAALEHPHLKRLLAAMTPGERDQGDEWTLTPPHERALGAACGWRCADGLVPLAAWQLATRGVDPGALAWALLTPAHWHLGTEQLTMTDPATLALDEPTSRALFDAVAPLFTSEGFRLHFAAPLEWYAGHPELAALPTASLDRVVGRNVDRWLPEGAGARRLRRLQNEVQMLLHGHPVNADREARGLVPVNTVWVSGSGVLPPSAAAAPRIDRRLCRPALAEDWAAWAKAWDQLDHELAERPPERLTLAGERGALTFERGDGGLLRRLASAWTRRTPQAWMEAL